MDEKTSNATTNQSPNAQSATGSPPTPPKPDQPLQLPAGGKPASLVIALIIIAGVVLVGCLGYAFYLTLGLNNTGGTGRQTAAAHVKIGVLAAFSGGSEKMGDGILKGVELAKKQLSADNLEIVQADSKCDPVVAAVAVKRLVDEKVSAIIGDGCSAVSQAVLPLVNEAKIPLVSPSSSSALLALPDDYFFRVVPSDLVHAASVAQAMYSKGYRNVAIFYTAEPYGDSMQTAFAKAFTELGGKIATRASATENSLTLDTQIKQIAAAQPDAIFSVSNSTVVAIGAIKLARGAGLTMPLYTLYTSLYDKSLVTDAGAAAEGLIISTFPAGTEAFQKDVAAAYPGMPPLYAAAQAYDALHALYLAVQSGATTGEQVKASLSGANFQGVSGRVMFDKNGDIADPAYHYDLLQVKQGKFTPAL